jgi:nicotinic acid phosphoribosyltransferase
VPGASTGPGGAVAAARAFYIAGVRATPNVLAGLCYGLPLAGTQAHSFIQACDDELSAFRAFVREFPDTVLLVDTYDKLKGVERERIEWKHTGACCRARRRYRIWLWAEFRWRRHVR